MYDSDPIAESLPIHTDIVTEGTQVAWYAVVRVLIPHTDVNGTPVDSVDAASDYVSETLRGQFLDWAYDERPTAVTVTDPYVEGQI